MSGKGREKLKAVKRKVDRIVSDEIDAKNKKSRSTRSVASKRRESKQILTTPKVKSKVVVKAAKKPESKDSSNNASPIKKSDSRKIVKKGEESAGKIDECSDGVDLHVVGSDHEISDEEEELDYEDDIDDELAAMNNSDFETMEEFLNLGDPSVSPTPDEEISLGSKQQGKVDGSLRNMVQTLVSQQMEVEKAYSEGDAEGICGKTKGCRSTEKVKKELSGPP